MWTPFFPTYTTFPRCLSACREFSKWLKAPTAQPTDVAGVLMTDPVISAKILKLANSSYYGFRQKIGSIRQAIALLGFATLKNTLLSASVFEMYKTRIPGLDLEGLWLHLFGTRSREQSRLETRAVSASRKGLRRVASCMISAR